MSQLINPPKSLKCKNRINQNHKGIIINKDNNKYKIIECSIF